ncbi:MAG: 16S rRNA (guanine(527)-N(7))-methyltransferase RsmG [Bacilli bacterium]
MFKEEFLIKTKELGIAITEEMLNKLDTYYHILKEENNKYNLTRIIEEDAVYLKHFYDSLTITKVIDINNQIICDIGSGAGFPGLVLAICFPNTKLTLIESNGKKCNFLNIVKDKLNLTNVTILNARAEEFSKNNREVFDIVTARAVAPLKHLLEYGIPLLKIGGYFITMKANVENEEVNITNYYNKLNIKEVTREVFNLPKEDSIRTIIKYQKLKETDSKYPRRYSEIIKRDI